MAVNPNVEGRVYPTTKPYVVSRAKIAEFAAAVGARDAAHTDVVVARARGYADAIAPPTFAVIVAQQGWAGVMADEEVGIDYSRLVHGAEEVVHYRPLVAGDEVTAHTRIERASNIGDNSMITLVTELKVGTEAVTRTMSVIVIRGSEA
ncbi:FAS1-like dehydratase domain-containing protein [Nocardia terpenica]|uniref:MaoC family dehydratase n=1 Tax=Nocardia terpenica TaxID=455432 RepID=A0A6G9Z076_9NOCA|nr:MaoC family dehydratase N-terminal domain-containing protein [Nocardia terpenica]QIS18473.1 MaoC family dehydratase [Nocardia terpenica]